MFGLKTRVGGLVSRDMVMIASKLSNHNHNSVAFSVAAVRRRELSTAASDLHETLKLDIIVEVVLCNDESSLTSIDIFMSHHIDNTLHKRNNQAIRVSYLVSSSRIWSSRLVD